MNDQIEPELLKDFNRLAPQGRLRGTRELLVALPSNEVPQMQRPARPRGNSLRLLRASIKPS